MTQFNKLYTSAGEKISSVPWNVYPRPQLKRDSFLCLNGKWEFTVSDSEKIPEQYDMSILVPFCPESLLSGINKHFEEGSYLWYRRQFSVPSGFNKERIILHFGASDQITAVFINGNLIGEHTGGYDPFSFDITEYCTGECNTLEVRAFDSLKEGILPSGKQSMERGGIFYTPVSGIWQTVWIESVPTDYIKSLKIDADDKNVTVLFDGVKSGNVTVYTDEGNLDLPFENGKLSFRMNNPHLWTPEDPYLYRFEISSGKDSVESYFAMRKLEIKEVNGYNRLCLNGKPYFFHGLLDQGYWSDGLFTPAAYECFSDEIIKLKELGFNTLRKHIKIEPELFYYDCDRLGMVVFQDMINNGPYSYMGHKALIHVTIKREDDRFMNPDEKLRKEFERYMKVTVNLLYNHPSIFYWTIFNEGWGQFCSSKMYDILIKLDNTRFIDSASGWYSGGKTQVCSKHIYHLKMKSFSTKMPYVISEFGGFAWKKDNEHVFNPDVVYSYGTYSSRESLIAEIRKLYIEQIVPRIETGLCGTIYTEVSDVEDEINGIFSYDRKVQKILPSEFADVSAMLKIE